STGLTRISIFDSSIPVGPTNWPGDCCWNDTPCMHRACALTKSALGRVRCLRICAAGYPCSRGRRPRLDLLLVGRALAFECSALPQSLLGQKSELPRRRQRPIANPTILFIVTGSMKSRAATIIVLAFVSAPLAFGGNDRDASPSTAMSDEPPRFDFAVESAYLFGAFNPPRNYEISADFLTARMRWGNYLDREGFFRGYNQVYFSFLAEPIIRGIENHYFG